MTDYKEKYEQAISRAKEVLSRAKETISAMTDMGGVAKVDDIHLIDMTKEDYMRLPKDMFPSLSYKDEPIEVELTIKKI